MYDVAVIIVAAGASTRFGRKDKQLVDLNGLPLFLHSVRNFLSVTDNFIVAVPVGRVDEFRAIAESYGFSGLKFTEGGSTRTQSVRNALKLADAKIVAIHDAARPYATAEMLVELIEAAQECGGAAPGVPLTDTLLCADDNGIMTGVVPRDGKWRISTPQVFELHSLLDAYSRAGDQTFTDDTQVFFNAGYKVRIIRESSNNMKITYSNDLKS